MSATNRDVMPKDEARIQPPPIDRAGMYTPDIQEMRANFRASFERDAAFAAQLKTLIAGVSDLLEAYNSDHSLLIALAKRTEEHTARVEALAAADATAKGEVLTKLDGVTTKVAQLVNVAVSGQQDLATHVRQDIAKGLSGNPAPPANPQSGPIGPAAADAVVATLQAPALQPPTRYKRRNWLVGRCHIIEATVRPGMKPSQAATEIKQAIDDIRRVRAKGSIAIVLFPGPLASVTHVDASWEDEATRAIVYVVEPNHLRALTKVANAGGLDEKVSIDIAHFRAELTAIGEELKSKKDTERARARLRNLLTPLLDRPNGDRATAASNTPASPKQPATPQATTVAPSTQPTRESADSPPPSPSAPPAEHSATPGSDGDSVLSRIKQITLPEDVQTGTWKEPSAPNPA